VLEKGKKSLKIPKG